MEQLLDLGNGLRIIKASIDDIREQDINARQMNKNMFDRLVANIKRDGRLESLPFCAITEKGIELISGHHRVRAARSAGMNEIIVIADITDMSRCKIMSKQLAHNTLQGDDNQQIVKQIYDMIEDAEERLAAFVDYDTEIKYDIAKITNVSVDMDIKTILIAFLAYEQEVFERAAEKITEKYDEIYLADIKYAELFKSALNRTSKEYDIRAMSTTLYKMSEITLEYFGEEQKDMEREALRDLFGTAYIPSEAAHVIRQAIEKMQKNGVITKANKWQFIEYLASDYLAGK